MQELILELNGERDLIFLTLAIAYKRTGPKGIEEGLKTGSYDENVLLNDLQDYIIKKFPRYTRNDFLSLWKRFNAILENYDLLPLDKELHGEFLGKKIYNSYKFEIVDEIKENMKNLNSEEKVIAYYFLSNIENELGKLDPPHIIFSKMEKKFKSNLKNINTELIGNTIIRLGLIFKSIWINSKGESEGIVYIYPDYLELLKNELLSDLSLNKKEKKVFDIIIEEEREEGNLYSLQVEWKGKKDSKRISFGIKGFNVGVKFGGEAREKLELKCGNKKCNSSNNFFIVDRENLIFRCAECKKLNCPNKADEKYFQ